MTDITPEAVERFIQTTMKEAVLSGGMPRNADDTKDAYATVTLLRALSARIAELEERNKRQALELLQVHGQYADQITTARAATQPTPAEAATISDAQREDIVDTIENIISETHELDVRDSDYAENIVSWLEQHHPAALRAISETPQ